MKFILFEKSAVCTIAEGTMFQSIEFPLGSQLISFLRNGIGDNTKIGTIRIQSIEDGLFFVGKDCEKEFLLFDLKQSQLLNKETNDSDLLLVLQKTFRTAIRIWNKLPFTSSEYIHETKSILFPFAYSDHRRVVIERSPKCERLKRRGIDRPLLVYKYGKEDAPRGEEIAKTDVLREAGEEYIDLLFDFQQYYRNQKAQRVLTDNTPPIVCASTNGGISRKGFLYLQYDQKLSMLSDTQKMVVENEDVDSPIRIDGAAGTGKTTSMIMRALHLLRNAKNKERPFKIAFFSHSDSANREAIHAFSLFDESDYFTSRENDQSIAFSTLFDYCIETIGVPKTKVLDNDPVEAKQYQSLLIADSVEEVVKTKYMSYKALLSDELKNQFDESKTPRDILFSMLQHEFGVQIKGRTDGTIEEYRKLPHIDNALRTCNERDKEFIFQIFTKYQSKLEASNVFDCDDIIVQALAQWNAPFWRRDRSVNGFDYIFVDEMHLFNINEQYAFHYLTKSLEQKKIPICFALDYCQAIGDRGDVRFDYIERTFGTANKKKYKTVFRSSQQITDFCAAISASGALMFQQSYRSPYDTATSIFTAEQEQYCKKPCIYFYPNDEEMIQSIKSHVDTCKRELNCKNRDIAIVSFEPTLLYTKQIERLSQMLNQKVLVLHDRMSDLPEKRDDRIIISDPYSINGLEFDCVILVGVDEGRVPQSKGVTDISLNYLKYSAFNKLYLASSRAKYRLILLGNDIHGCSSCLNYALEKRTIEKETLS